MLILRLGLKRRFELWFGGAQGTVTSLLLVNMMTLKMLRKKLVE
jgi:hypothetical protein